MAWFWWGWWDDFDKRFCGKWISEATHFGRIFLNIEFDENKKGVKVDFSFGVSDFNNPTFYVENSYNSLYFFHNDKQNRIEYTLTIDENDDNKAKCKIIQRNSAFEKDDIEFTRLSEEEEKRYKPKATARIDILREYAEYGSVKTDARFKFKLDERKNMLDIIEKNNLDELVKGKNDMEIAIVLMNWLSSRYKHGNPPGSFPKKRTPQVLMEFADKNEGRINCRGLSIILTKLIRAYNIKAFHITCMPYEQPFDDCHVVVCVYCEKLNKWIMLDPSFNLYLKNKNGEIIGVDELRDILISDKELLANEDMKTAWIDTIKDYRDYMAKNLIRIERYIVNGHNYDAESGGVILIPEKYMQNEAKNFDAESHKNFITSRENFWQV
jgi:hypothetical protein